MRKTTMKRLTNESGEIRQNTKPKGSVKKQEPCVFLKGPSPIYFPKKKRKK